MPLFSGGGEMNEWSIDAGETVHRIYGPYDGGHERMFSPHHWHDPDFGTKFPILQQILNRDASYLLMIFRNATRHW